MNLTLNLIKREKTFTKTKIYEITTISISFTVNLRPGTYKISHFLAERLLLQCAIFNNNID